MGPYNEEKTATIYSQKPEQMSDTPRTDALIIETWGSLKPFAGHPIAEFARKLERELTVLLPPSQSRIKCFYCGDSHTESHLMHIVYCKACKR